MRIKWLDDAVHDLYSLRQYIAQDNNSAAKSVAKKIIDTVELLAEQPAIGRQGRVSNTRELVVSGTSYIVPYRIKNEVVEVLRILHCAMKWPNEF